MQNQLSRMFDYPNFTFNRARVASATYRRYAGRIQRNLGYRNVGSGLDYANTVNMQFTNPRYQSLRAINSARVPVRSYMGNNNG